MQKVEHGGVEYQLKGTQRHGDSWVMTVIATSQLGKKAYRFPRAVSYAKGGGTYHATRVGMKTGGRGIMEFPQEIPTEVQFNMGNVPSSVHDFIRVEITPDQESGPGIVFNNVHLD